MIEVPLVPFWIISLLAIATGILAFVAIFRFPKMKSSSRAGLWLISPALVAFGILYYYYVSSVSDQIARQVSVRLAMFYMFLSLFIWQIILHKKDGNGK